jgi:cytochrome P450
MAGCGGTQPTIPPFDRAHLTCRRGRRSCTRAVRHLSGRARGRRTSAGRLGRAAGGRPFWLVPLHADIVAMERRGAPFGAARDVRLAGDLAHGSLTRQESPWRDDVQMDDPNHGLHREMAAPWFTRGPLAGLEDRIAAFARARCPQSRGQRHARLRSVSKAAAHRARTAIGRASGPGRYCATQPGAYR